ncbi:MAG: hypothetical protein WC290_03340 [archaeon]|jgi:hypothetical protein|nr:hypothetical protein [archaeon]
MPGFFRKLLGLKPKPKVKIPNFKNAEEYFEWRHKTYNEPLPTRMEQAKMQAKLRTTQEAEQRRNEIRTIANNRQNSKRN